MKKNAWPITFFLLLSVFWISFQVLPQEKKQGIFDLIHSENALKLEIEVDLESLLENKNTNDYFPAVLKFEDNQEKKQKWEVEVRSRGKFRRKVCQFPPLKIKFPKKDLKEEGFNKHNEFKLVTHCTAALDADEYLLREFLIYKLFNIISDTGFRAQLIRATYKDGKSSTRIKRYAILLEDEEDLEDRMESKVCDECYNWPVEELNLEEIHKVCLFQFMIGNTDWSFKFLRNLKLLMPKDSSGYIASPYDFDFAGLVNVPYAIPNADYALENCRQRYFIGFVEEERELAATILLFQSKKQEMIEYVQNFKYLDKSSKKDIIRYMETFYASIEQGDFLNRVVDPEELD